MSVAAQELTDADIANLAAYYSGMLLHRGLLQRLRLRGVPP
jgi:cytochrome c553